MMQGSGYTKALYEIPVLDLWAAQPIMGIYILRSARSIYCGLGTTLSTRLPRSLRERGFGNFINYFSENLLRFPNGALRHDYMKILETNTISALHTIIWGHGLPLHLANKKDAEWLPGAAWTKDPDLEYRLPIEIAQTVLYRMGVPFHMTGLPSYIMINTNLPMQLRKRNEAQWNDIVLAELAARKRSKYSECPLFVVHPA